MTDPGYATALSLALEHRNVFVTRTLSKAYGMAGLRVGYAVGQARTMEAFNRWAITFNQNSLSVAAAVAALGDPAHIEAERARNTEVRQFTTSCFQGLGYRVLPTQTNFVLVDIGRPALDELAGLSTDENPAQLRLSHEPRTNPQLRPLPCQPGIPSRGRRGQRRCPTHGDRAGRAWSFGTQRYDGISDGDGPIPRQGLGRFP